MRQKTRELLNPLALLEIKKMVWMTSILAPRESRQALKISTTLGNWRRRRQHIGMMILTMLTTFWISLKRPRVLSLLIPRRTDHRQLESNLVLATSVSLYGLLVVQTPLTPSQSQRLATTWMTSWIRTTKRMVLVQV